MKLSSFDKVFLGFIAIGIILSSISGFFLFVYKEPNTHYLHMQFRITKDVNMIFDCWSNKTAYTEFGVFSYTFEVEGLHLSKNENGFFYGTINGSEYLGIAGIQEEDHTIVGFMEVTSDYSVVYEIHYQHGTHKFFALVYLNDVLLYTEEATLEEKVIEHSDMERILKYIE